MVVRFGEREIPHDDVTAQAAKIAGALGEAGVEHGDRVAIVLRNEPTFLAISAACSQIGRGGGTDQLALAWPRARARPVAFGRAGGFVHSDLVATVEEALPESVPLVEVPVPPETAARYGDAPATGRHALLDDWIAAARPRADAAASARMSLIYTSGTTGLAKGVLREATGAEQSQQVAAATLAAMGLRPGMRTLITAPMYHAAPNAQAVFALALGIELTIMPRFEPEEFLRLVEAQRITHAQTVPTMFVRLLELPDEVRGATTSARSSASSMPPRRAPSTSSGG